MAQTVVGMFDNASEAQQAVQKLVSEGISRDRIDISNNTSGSNASHSSNANHISGDHHESGIAKFFKNLFGDDDDDADRYAHVASRTECLVTVHAQSGDEAERAADILDDNGAVDVDEHAAKNGYSSISRSSNDGSSSNTFGDRSKTVGAFDTGTSAGLTGTASTAGDFNDTIDTDRNSDTSADFAGNDTTSNDETTKVPIIEQNLEVGKREVRSGGVRLRSRIIEKPVEESVRLKEEHVNVERNKVDRPATEADFKNFDEKDIEMVERTEVPVVNKQARVVEEVSLNKNVSERNETVSGTVRKTEVDVTDLDKDNLNDRSTRDF
jgi:stress response protein YsnF